MYIRDYKGNIVYFDITKYKNEKQLYKALWKIKFNINIAKKDIDFNSELMGLIIS